MGCTCLTWTAGGEEIITLPLGPIETNQIWYARSRLAVAVLGAKLWSRSCPRGHWYQFASRVLEKTAAYSFSLLGDLLKLAKEDGLLEGVREVKVWSDTGPHFRAYHLLASTAVELTEAWGVNFRFAFGLERHFKNECDGHFAVLGRRVELKRKTKMLATVADLIEAWREGFEMAKKSDPLYPDETSIDYVPAEKTLLAMWDFHNSDWPAPIKACHEWSTSVLDRRRKRYKSRNGAMLTSVRVNAHMIPNGTAPYTRSTNLRLEPVDNKAAPEDCEKQEVPAGVFSSEISLATRYVNSWRCSYRLEKPEQIPAEDFKPRLRRKLDALKEFKGDVPENGRRPSTAVRLAAARSTMAKKNEIAMRKRRSAREADAA